MLCCQVELVDFGASREYSKEFIDKWFCLLEAAISGDRDACIEWSMKLGYLTGQETEVISFPPASSITYAEHVVDHAGRPREIHDGTWVAFQTRYLATLCFRSWYDVGGSYCRSQEQHTGDVEA
jgi:hypothetical protein